jgi:thiamine-phosphate pyrophosphorylase
MRPAFDPRLYLVTDPSFPLGLLATVEAALKGGVSLLQLRDKEADDASLIEQGQALAALAARYGVPLILNDRPDLVVATGAAGCHIGPGDMALAEARRLIGPDALLGLSVETPAQMQSLTWEHLDYIAASPVFATASKPDHSPPLGLEGLRAFCAQAPVPVVAIGGIGPANLPSIRAAGAAGAALISAIGHAPDPEAAARTLTDLWSQS